MAYTTIDDPSAHFQTALWSGDNASTQNITNDGNSDLQPDWVWVKCRNTSGNGFDHTVWDTSRGVDNNLNKSISTSQPDNQGLGDNVTTTAQLGGVSAMLSDGFTVREGSIDNDSRYVNESSRTYVGWQWKCNGGTTSTNSDGTVNTTMQLNSTAGFSIITWTGAGNNTSTAGHGLGAIPDCIIVKNREDAQNWSVAFPKFETSKLMSLNTDAAFSSASGLSSYNSSTFVDGSGGSSEDYIAYCFKPIQGYSKFSKYTGNGNTDGPFVYTGFKPAWLMIKRSDSANSWYLVDGTRGSSNVISAELEANNDGAEATGNVRLDILSNGYKIRTSGAAYNASGGTYVYMAFAENPFVSSEGVPTTAR